MQVEQIDAVAAEALQNFAKLLANLLRLQALVVPRVDLGGDIDIIRRLRGQYPPQHFLGLALAVGMRGVEFVVAGVEKLLHQDLCCFLFDLVAESHGA
jgi:hypothetical protein